MPDEQDLSPDFYRGSNFLGRPTDIRLTGGEPGQPGGSLDAGVGGLPQGPGAGSSPSGDKGGGGGGPATTIPSSSPSILALLQTGMRIEDIVSRLTSNYGAGAPGGFARDPGSEDAFQAFRAGERGDFGGLAGFGSAETLGQVSGGELALGSEGAGATSSAIPGGLVEGAMTLGQAAPIWAGLTAAVDLLGEGKLPFQNVLNMIFGFDNPSAEWQSFGPRLAGTLRGEDAATTTLARTLATASPQDVPAAIAAWRQSVGDVVQGFGAGAGPLDIPGMPGATGAAHEGKQSVDWGPTTAGLQALVQAALAGLPPAQRIEAFRSGAQPLLDAQAAQRAALEAEQAGVSAFQGSQQNVGSA